VTSKSSSGSASRSPKAEAILGSAPDEQIGAAIAAQKWARATDLLEFHGERLLLDGGVRELAGWLGALPDDYITRHAKVAALFAWVCIYGQRYQVALTYLSKAERALQQLRIGASAARDASTSDEVELRPFVELEQSLVAIRLHLLAVAGVDGKLPAQVEDIMIPASGDHPLWRAGALVVLGRSRFQAGDLRGAADDLEAAYILASSSRGGRAGRVAADAAVLLGRIDEARGKLNAAVKRYEAVIAAPGLTLGPRLGAEVGLARVALVQLDLAQAGKRLDAVRTALDEARAATPDDALAANASAVDPVRVVCEGDLARATLHLLEGRPDEARALLDQLDKTLGGLDLRWPMALIGATRARHALLRKDESGARRWLQQYTMRGESNQAPRNPNAAFEEVTQALTQAALHQPKPALKAAQDALGFAEASGHKQLQVEAQVAMALAHYGAGAREEARSALIAATEGAKAMGGALLPLLVRGLDAAAAELGVASDELTRAASFIPALAPQQRERSDRPVSRPSNASGPIETSKVAPEAVPTSMAGDLAREEVAADDAPDATASEPAPALGGAGEGASPG